MTGFEVALLAASAGLSAVGAVAQGQAANAQGKAAQRAAEYNAKVQEVEAKQRSREANLEEESRRRRIRQILGGQRAELAESGIGFEEMGQSLIADSAKFGELEALNVRYSGETARRGLLAGANIARFQGQAARAAGRAQRNASYLKAASSLASGGYQISQVGGSNG